jgi:eukaryotic-like serine/threonine-protein kinase
MVEAAQSAAGVNEGTILAGKYRVDQVLGVGGMGAVVAARHLELNHRVAIKFLLPALLSDAGCVERFAREARAAVRITSEHVARVFDVGTLDNGAPYMVMEFLEGDDLAEWIRKRGPLPIDQAVDFLLQASVAIADAHSLGIVHRDLKPANLFCVRRNDGQYFIKVLDFGISKLTEASTSESGMSVTQTSTVMGSPLYMSPEQLHSAKDVDARTDVWALGVILFELLTGTVPFPGESFGELAVKIAIRPAPPLRSLRPDAPRGLEAVVSRCLEKDRARRYPDVAEMARALLPFAPERARSSIDRISGIAQATRQSGVTLDASHRADSTLLAPGTIPPVGRTTLGRTPRRGAMVAIGGAAATLAVLAGVAVTAMRGHADPDRAAASVTAAPPVVAPAALPQILEPPATVTAAPVEASVATPEPPPPPAPDPPPAPKKGKHLANPMPGVRKQATGAAPSAEAETADPLKSLQFKQ